MTLM
ncbi:MAG: protein of unknown function DUF1838, partial [Porphyrobacter sp. HL-46]|jgi:Mg2+ and Co2+ transporter CorA